MISDDIATVTNRDEVAVQVLTFIQVTNTILSKYEPKEIELNEYELKLEYVILYSGSGQYAIAVVVHDKKDHSNALVTLDFLSKEEYKKYNHSDNTSMVKPERLSQELVTAAITKKVLELSQDKIVKPVIKGVIRSQ